MLTRAGGWLFRHRTPIPMPIILALLVIPPPASQVGLWTPAGAAGVLVIGLGEAIRLWAVHHIGAISRTRSERLGPLIDTGPFSLVRNPLYVGNLLLWIGFTIASGLLWLLPAVVVLLMLEYHAIVRWEERLLAARLGASYRDYMTRVSRWIPRLGLPVHAEALGRFSWSNTIFSERGTLIAIVAGLVLLALKARGVAGLS